MENPRVECVDAVDIHLRKLLWMYSSGHAGVKGNDRVNRLTGKATNTSGLFQASSFEELETSPAGTKRVTSRHRSS